MCHKEVILDLPGWIISRYNTIEKCQKMLCSINEQTFLKEHINPKGVFCFYKTVMILTKSRNKCREIAWYKTAKAVWNAYKIII